MSKCLEMQVGVRRLARSQVKECIIANAVFDRISIQNRRFTSRSKSFHKQYHKQTECSLDRKVA